VADLERVTKWADALIRLHLDPAVWSFGFDHARTRAGLCNFTDKRISVSRHLAAKYEDDEVHQILLHEVAHAIAGPRAGHGPQWKSIAFELGYDGKRTVVGNLPRRSRAFSLSPARQTAVVWGLCAGLFSRQSDLVAEARNWVV
jgi:hypothetical protein